MGHPNGAVDARPSTPALPSQGGATAENPVTLGPSGTNDAGNEPEGAAGSVFDNLDVLRLGSNATALAGTREVLTRIQVRKPHSQEFVRVHPDPAMSFATSVFVDKVKRGEVYLVTPPMRGALAGELKPMLLMAAVTRQGVVMLWPVPLPGADGRTNPWWETAREAAELAKTTWVRVVSDMALGANRIYVAEGQLSEPEWPDMPLQRLLELAFRERVIDGPGHPILKRLRGET